MPHKSYSSLVSRRARAEAAVLKKANAYYATAIKLEKAGKPVRARIAANKARTLIRRIGKTALDGPVGDLTNPSDMSWDEAERLGILKRAGVNKPTGISNEKAFEISWYSSLKKARVRFVRPIKADSKGEAIAIAKSMISNDPKAKNFVAVAVKRNPKRNGVVEAAAGLQALEYLGGKARKSSLGKAPKFNTKRANPDTEIYLESYSSQYRGWITYDYRLAKNASEVREFASDFRKRAKALQKQYPFLVLRVRAIKRNEQSAVRNPRRKGSRDAFGVWHADAAENPDYNYVVSTEKRGRVQGITQALTAKRAKRKLRREYRPEGVKRVVVKRINPSMTDISRMFQGKANGALAEYKAPDSAPKDLARIGKLVFLKRSGVRKTLRIPGAMVAADTKGKLWIVGSRTPLLTRRANPGEGLDFGEIKQICYETAKTHIGDGKTFEYVHTFGEDGGTLPHLIVDHEGFPILRGGDYTIESRGIVN